MDFLTSRRRRQRMSAVSLNFPLPLLQFPGRGRRPSMPFQSSPSSETVAPATAEELRGWKEIAGYLGVDVRTAQRYEQEGALPVKRLEGGARGRVYAAVADIEQWKQASTQTQPWWNRVDGLRRAFFAACAAAAVLCGVVVWALWPPAGEPVRFENQGRYLVAFNANGEAIWRYPLPFEPRTEWEDTRDYGNPPIRVGDVDGDGYDDVLYWYRSRFYETPDILYCISSRGEKLWQYTPQIELRNSEESFSANYHLRAFRFLDVAPDGRPGGAAVAAFVNAWGYPAVVAVVEPDGEVRGEYAHAGHVEDLVVRDVDGDGRADVIASGFSQTHMAPTVVVLDPARLEGASVETADASLRILDRETAVGERMRLVFPATAVTTKRGIPNVAQQIHTSGDRIVIQIREFPAYGERERVRVNYIFNADMSLRAVQADENMQLAYEEARRTDPTVPILDEAELTRLQSLVKRFDNGSDAREVD